VAVALVLDVSVFHGGSAADMYDGRRRTVQEHGTRFDQPAPRAVTGLGRAAFSGSEWGKGIQVVGFDGNLYFELSWADTGHPDQVPPDIVDRLIRLARNVMVVLKD
jgi:hypothetical protein